MSRRIVSWLFPTVLLLAVVGSTFIFQARVVSFKAGHYGFLSSHGTAISKNLILSQNFPFMFHGVSMDETGTIVYEAYNRFSVFPFFLTGLVMAAFEPDLAMQIYAARQVMNVFYLLAMGFGLLIAQELTKNIYTAIAITLLSFSSYYVLLYHDMVFNDPAAFAGFVMALWVVAREYLRPLPLRARVAVACLSICLGWQAIAVFLTWLMVHVGDTIYRWFQGEAIPRKHIIQHASLVCLLVSGLSGIILLVWQLGSEYVAVGANGLADLPTFQSMVFRTGFGANETYQPLAATLDWAPFLNEQLTRFGHMFIPFTFIPANYNLIRAIILFVVFITLQRNLDYRIVLIFLLSGFVWAISMRSFAAFHEFQALFFIGFPILFFTSLCSYIRQSLQKPFVVTLVLLFMLSIAYSNYVKFDESKELNALTSDFQAIYNQLPQGSRVFIDGDRYTMGGSYHAVSFYLAGRIFAPADRADYVISANQAYNTEKLTNNPTINLFGNRPKGAHSRPALLRYRLN